MSEVPLYAFPWIFMKSHPISGDLCCKLCAGHMLKPLQGNRPPALKDFSSFAAFPMGGSFPATHLMHICRTFCTVALRVYS